VIGKPAGKHPLIALAMMLTVVSARAQSYGVLEQTLTIGAAAFESSGATESEIGPDGYLYDPDSTRVYLAPLSLPDGALLDTMCLYANDSDPDSLHQVFAFLMGAKLVPGGEDPFFMGLPVYSVHSEQDTGYQYSCTDPLTYTLRANADLDGDGFPEAVAYYVEAIVPGDTGNVLGLGGVQILWHRQVSPPPDAPSYADVPPGSAGYDEIEALAASGISAGCGAGAYCPDAKLTRRQMAVFLAKALGLHWVD